MCWTRCWTGVGHVTGAPGAVGTWLDAGGSLQTVSWCRCRDVSRCIESSKRRIMKNCLESWRRCQAAIMLPSAIIRFRLHGVPRRRRDPEEVESLNLRDNGTARHWKRRETLESIRSGKIQKINICGKDQLIGKKIEKTAHEKLLDEIR